MSPIKFLSLVPLISWLYCFEGKPKDIFDHHVDQCQISNNSFEADEYLVYRAYYNWGPIWIPAGEASFSLTEEDSLYHIKVIGKSYPSYDSFYKVYDEYDSWIDKETLQPRLFIRNVQEGSYSRYDSLIFDLEQNTLRSFFGKTKTTAKEYVLNQEGCMHDLLSVLYFVRNLDYADIPEDSMIPLNIFFDKELYPIKMEYGGKHKKKKIKGMGKHDVIKIIPEAIDGHVFDQNTKMTIWASDDEKKIPLLVESPVKIGKVKGVLIREKSVYTSMK